MARQSHNLPRIDTDWPPGLYYRRAVSECGGFADGVDTFLLALASATIDLVSLRVSPEFNRNQPSVSLLKPANLQSQTLA